MLCLILAFLPGCYDGGFTKRKVNRPTSFNISQEIEKTIYVLNHRENAKSLGIMVPNGILLVGDGPADEIINNIADKLEADSYDCSLRDILDFWIGSSERSIKKSIDEIRTFGVTAGTKTLVVLDGLDFIAQRDHADASGDAINEYRSMMSILLKAMDEFCDNINITFIAHVPSAYLLDEEFIKEMRFNRCIRIGLPNEETLEKLYQSCIVQSGAIFEDIDCAQFAQQSIGFTELEVEAVVKKAILIAFLDESETIELVHFNKAFYDLSKRMQGKR